MYPCCSKTLNRLFVCDSLCVQYILHNIIIICYYLVVVSFSTSFILEENFFIEKMNYIIMCKLFFVDNALG